MSALKQKSEDNEDSYGHLNGHFCISLECIVQTHTIHKIDFTPPTACYLGIYIFPEIKLLGEHILESWEALSNQLRSEGTPSTDTGDCASNLLGVSKQLAGILISLLELTNKKQLKGGIIQAKIERALPKLDPDPTIVANNPNNLDDVLANVVQKVNNNCNNSVAVKCVVNELDISALRFIVDQLKACEMNQLSLGNKKSVNDTIEALNLWITGGVLSTKFKDINKKKLATGGMTTSCNAFNLNGPTNPSEIQDSNSD
eukprot:jgi/Psemu1/1523/gm1.1523_g